MKISIEKLFTLLIFLLFLPGCGARGVPRDIPYAFVLFEPIELPSKEEVDYKERLEMLSSRWGNYIFYDAAGRILRRVQAPSGKLSPDGRKLFFTTPVDAKLRDLFTSNEKILADNNALAGTGEIRSAFSPDMKYVFFETGEADFENGPVLREIVRYNLETGLESGKCRLIDLPALTPDQGALVQEIWEHDPGGLAVSEDGRYAYTLAWNPAADSAAAFLSSVTSLETTLENPLYEKYYSICRMDFDNGTATQLGAHTADTYLLPPLVYDDLTQTLFLVERIVLPEINSYKILGANPEGSTFDLMESEANIHLLGLGASKDRLAFFVLTKESSGTAKKNYGVLDLKTGEPTFYFKLPMGINEASFGPELEWAVYISPVEDAWNELNSYSPPQGPRPYLHLVTIPNAHDSILFATDPPGKSLAGIVPLSALH